jgi:protein-tyrosine phosphatase
VIDLHCHVLPDIDDGPATLEDALKLCRKVMAAGTRMVVATPHVNWEYPEVNVAVIRDRLMTLRGALDQAGIDLAVQGGAEVALSRAGELTEDELRALRLGDGPNLLLELPWSSTPTGIARAVSGLAARGFGLLLAHPERTPMLRDHPELVRSLVEEGAYCCLNASSLTSPDRATRSVARRLLEAGLIHAIASDGHDPVRRPPELGPLLVGAGLDDEQIDYFTVRTPKAILAGEIPEPPPRVTGSGPGRWLRRLTG